jgi:HlyD family secretion protein
MDASSHIPVTKPSIRDTSAQDVLVNPATGLRKNRRIVILTAISLLILATLFSIVIRAWTSTTLVIPIDRIRIGSVTQGIFIRDVAAQGVVVAANSPTLFSPATGTVTFDVVAGDTVRKGQTLAHVDSPTLRNEYARERATLDSLNLSLERQLIDVRRQVLQNKQSSDQAYVQIHAAEREFARAESAFNQGVIAKRDLDKARDDLDVARLTHEHALANGTLQDDSLQFEIRSKRLERDRQKLLAENLARRVDELTIQSPVDGIIGSLIANQKANAAENAPLMTVVDLTVLEIEFRVPENYASELAQGMAAEISYGGKTYAGNVTGISPEVQQNEVRGRARFAGHAPDGLRQNQRVNVRVVMESRDNVVKVERGAFADSGSVAYVLQDDLAVRRPIKIGAMSMGEVEIISGLTSGEQIIISNLSDFNDAAEVRISR